MAPQVLRTVSAAATAALLMSGCSGNEDEDPTESSSSRSEPSSPSPSATPTTQESRSVGTKDVGAVELVVTEEYVDVGGYPLFLQCWGEAVRAEPTVLLLSGAELTISSWLPMAENFAAEGHHVCAYDRAGVGNSYPPPTAKRRTVQDQVSDLRTMLGAAGLTEPLILVAHSAGALPVIELADSALDRMAGVVLVDPLTPRLSIRQRQALPPARPRQSEDLDQEHWFLNDFYLDPSQNPEHLLLAENDSRLAKLLSAPGPIFGDVPVIVLQAPLPERPPGLPLRYILTTEAAINEGLAEFAAESTRGEHRHVEDTGHTIQQDQPDVVKDAIRDLLAG